MKEKYYAIQVIGCGKRQRFAIQLVTPGKGTTPTTGRSYATLEQAQAVAAANGYTIEKVGDYYTIIC